MKKIKLAFLIVGLFLAINRISFSQTDSSAQKYKTGIIKTSVNTLQQKILLTNEQNAKIEQILFNYVNENSINKSKDIILDKIEKLLNDRQKDKFEIIKNDWWGHFSKQFNAK